MNRYFLSFILVLSLYASLIFGYMIYFKNDTLAKSVKKVEKRVTFKIITKTTKPKKKIIKKVTKQKVEPKHIKPKPKIKKKKKIIKKHKIIKKKKKIVKKEVLKPKPITKEQIKKPTITRVEKTKIVEKTVITKEDKQLKELQKQQYFRLIREMISQNKIYPRKARRRGIQGSVMVKFRVSKDGNLLSLNILDGKKIFYKSVKKAINNTFPVATPKGIFQSSFGLELTMVYSLN